MSAIENQAPTGNWKRWLFVGIGFVAGVAVATAVIAAYTAWHSSRPKQWDNRDIRATFSRPLFNYKDGDTTISGESLEYIIENTTSTDFTITPQQTLFFQDGEALRRVDAAYFKIDEQCLVPAKNKVKCEIGVPTEFDTTNRLDGFVLFDDATHYSIIFPKPTGPTPALRAKFLNDMLKRQDNSNPAK